MVEGSEVRIFVNFYGRTLLLFFFLIWLFRLYSELLRVKPVLHAKALFTDRAGTKTTTEVIEHTENNINGIYFCMK